MGVESPQFERFLVDPSIPRSQKVAGLNAIFSELKFSDTTKRFFGAPPVHEGQGVGGKLTWRTGS